MSECTAVGTDSCQTARALSPPGLPSEEAAAGTNPLGRTFSCPLGPEQAEQSPIAYNTTIPVPLAVGRRENIGIRHVKLLFGPRHWTTHHVGSRNNNIQFVCQERKGSAGGPPTR